MGHELLPVWGHCAQWMRGQQASDGHGGARRDNWGYVACMAHVGWPGGAGGSHTCLWVVQGVVVEGVGMGLGLQEILGARLGGHLWTGMGHSWLVM